jgi:small subunit ribosomal protein S8e
LAFISTRPEQSGRSDGKEQRARILPEKDQIQVEAVLEDKFAPGLVLAFISYRPGQSGCSDGYILEGKELEFYLKKIKSKKGNK